MVADVYHTRPIMIMNIVSLILLCVSYLGDINREPAGIIELSGMLLEGHL